MKQKIFAVAVVAFFILGLSVEVYAANLIQPLAGTTTSSTTTTQTCFAFNPASGGAAIPIAAVNFQGSYVVFHVQLSNGTAIQVYVPTPNLTRLC